MRQPGLQIRISVNLNFELLNFKFELANLRTFLKLRTSPYRFPPIFKKCCILEKSRKNLAKIWPKFSKNSAKFGKFCENLQKKTAKFSAIFNENFAIRERCKGVHCVDLGESFPTSIYLQNLASIQPRTSPEVLKFELSEFWTWTSKFRTSYLQPRKHLPASHS